MEQFLQNTFWTIAHYPEFQKGKPVSLEWGRAIDKKKRGQRISEQGPSLQGGSHEAGNVSAYSETPSGRDGQGSFRTLEGNSAATDAQKAKQRELTAEIIAG